MIGITYLLDRAEHGLPVTLSLDGTHVKVGKDIDSPAVFFDKRNPPDIVDGRIINFLVGHTTNQSNLDMVFQKEDTRSNRDIVLLTQGVVQDLSGQTLETNEVNNYQLLQLSRGQYARIKTPRNGTVNLRNKGDGILEIGVQGKPKYVFKQQK
jgi:hypothetical protein